MAILIFNFRNIKTIYNMNKKIITDTLIELSANNRQTLKDFNRLLFNLKRASRFTNCIPIEDVHSDDIDTLIRLKRNTNAQIMLLSMTIDAFECANDNIHIILENDRKREEISQMRKKAALEKATKTN